MMARAAGLIGGAMKARDIVKVLVMVVGLVMVVRFLIRREIAVAGTAGRAAGLIGGATKAREIVKALAMVSDLNLINSNMWHLSSCIGRILTRLTLRAGRPRIPSKANIKIRRKYKSKISHLFDSAQLAEVYQIQTVDILF